jgi:hypothetical protein
MLALLCAQGVVAESLRPNVDAGGSGGSASAGEPQPAFVVHPNLRSIQLIEGKEVANDTPAPSFAMHPNLWSILMIEGKQAVAKVAQPASLSAYAVCLACSSLG